MIRTVPNLMERYGCSAEDAQRYMDLREEGYQQHEALLMAGLSDPPLTLERNMDLQDRIELIDDEFLKFERVETKFSNRPDLHAFILLDKLVPGDSYLISCSEHDEFFFSIDPDTLNGVITDEQLLELVRCGVRYDASLDSLCMFA